MAEYKEIHGTKIRNYTTNPDNPKQGEVWYNETDNVLKFQYANVTSAGSWRTGNDLNSLREYGTGTGVDNTAVLIWAGFPNSALTEQYDGVSWTEVNDLNTARRYPGAAGTYTAALGFGGGTPITGKTETWNGTNWTEVNDLGTA